MVPTVLDLKLTDHNLLVTVGEHREIFAVYSKTVRFDYGRATVKTVALLPF